MKLEQLAKQFVRENICKECLERMLKSNPKMLDCAFRHNNDEHLCPCMTPKQALAFARFVIGKLPKDEPNDIYTESGIITAFEELEK